MTVFLLYVLSVSLTLSIAGLFVFLAGRLVLHDSGDLLRHSLRSILGGIDLLAPSRWGRKPPPLQHLQVLDADRHAGVTIGQTLPLRTPITTVGRGQTNHLILADPLVSGQHLSFSFEHGAWWVLDRGSRNGTWLHPAHGDGKRVADRPEKLLAGDVVEVGSVRLRLVP